MSPMSQRECMANGILVEEPCSPEFQQARRIYVLLLEMGFLPWRRELSMYSTILQCAGQADLVMLAQDGSLVIVDWKRTKQLVYENKFRCLRYPLDLPDTNYWLYATVDGVKRHWDWRAIVAIVGGPRG